MDTVAAHVNTSATVMVSNVQGEIHGAIPTMAHCGTAMTGSKSSIDALGAWMVDLVGSENGKDLPLVLQGTTQITGFQQQSMSLHALKEAGFNCSHVLTQRGTFLNITANEIQYCFPLITIDGGDFIEMRVHRPSLSLLPLLPDSILPRTSNLKVCTISSIFDMNALA
jgi:hypothetical protein